MLAPQTPAKQPTSNSFVTNDDVTSVVTGGQVPAIVTGKAHQDRAPSRASIPAVASHDDPASIGGPSRFTHVSEVEARESVFGSPPVSNPKHEALIHRLSIAMMVAAFMGCIALGWWMFRLDPADDLYAEIAAAVDSGDEDQLTEARSAIDEFIERFPEDSRHGEVQSLADDADLQQMLSNLQRTAARKGDSLSAMEQAFLDCLVARERTPEVYKTKLKAFLSVYGLLTGLSKREQRLVELARFAEKVQPSPKLAILPATIQLEKLIRTAEADLSGEALNSYYRDLLVLYDGKPWAAEQLARIRERIASDSTDGK